ncbi:MAG: hypothetical protein AUJ47_07565, partial [Candidatus Marinimicrobia bacterium CG1_02_48_14]
MTLQTDLQDAVARVQTDSQLLHTIVHGDDQTEVPTDGGNVKSAAKAIKDIEDGIQAGLTDLGASADQLNAAVSQTETYRDEAQSSAQSALQTANALNLPTNINGQAGKLLAVKQTEDGFEVIESVGVFYGLRADGSKLTAITGQGTYNANDFDTWFITLPGVDFNINEDG